MLSLDAPVIAALWQDLFARDAGVQLSIAARIALPVTVWFIYLVDRLLDTQGGKVVPDTTRHAFYRARRRTGIWLSIAAAALAALCVFFLPAPVMNNGLLVSGVVVLYMLIIHGLRGHLRHLLPKEAAVGFLFALGCALAPLSRSAQPQHLFLPVFFLGFLCWLNSAAIETWERGSLDRVSGWMVRHFRAISVVVCLLAIFLLAASHERSWIAVFIAACGYVIVDSCQRRSRYEQMRVSIDIPLLAPLALFFFR